MADSMKNQGLAKRVRAAEVAAGIVAWDGVEAPTTTAKTKTDRFSIIRRLRKLESVQGLAATGADKIRNNRMGVENRIRAIFATLVIVLALFMPALAQAAPTYKAALIAYSDSDPTGGCSGFEKLWWNTTSDSLFFCENGVWKDAGGNAVSTTFPLVAPDGDCEAGNYQYGFAANGPDNGDSESGLCRDDQGDWIRLRNVDNSGSIEANWNLDGHEFVVSADNTGNGRSTRFRVDDTRFDWTTLGSGLDANVTFRLSDEVAIEFLQLAPVAMPTLTYVESWDFSTGLVEDAIVKRRFEDTGTTTYTEFTQKFNEFFHTATDGADTTTSEQNEDQIALTAVTNTYTAQLTVGEDAAQVEAIGTDSDTGNSARMTVNEERVRLSAAGPGNNPNSATTLTRHGLYVGNLKDAAVDTLALQGLIEGGYTVSSGASPNDPLGDTVTITVVDTTPSITYGLVNVCGPQVLDGPTMCEQLTFNGANVGTTSQSFLSVTYIKSSQFTVLDGGGDETIAAEWFTGPVEFLSAEELVNHTASDFSSGSIDINANYATLTCIDIEGCLFAVAAGADKQELTLATTGGSTYITLTGATMENVGEADYILNGNSPTEYVYNVASSVWKQKHAALHAIRTTNVAGTEYGFVGTDLGSVTIGALGASGSVGISASDGVNKSSAATAGLDYYLTRHEKSSVGATSDEIRVSGVSLTDNTATTFVSVSISPDRAGSIFLDYTATTVSGGEQQVIMGRAHLAIINDNSTETCSAVTELGEISQVSAGTTSFTLTCDTSGSDQVILKATVDSSLDVASLLSYTILAQGGLSAVPYEP